MKQKKNNMDFLVYLLFGTLDASLLGNRSKFYPEQ